MESADESAPDDTATGPGAATALAARYGVPAGQVRALPSGGANRVFLLGDGLVLRMPRTREAAAGLRKEAEVVPVARAAGVRTPEIVAFEDGDGSETDVPHMVVRRAAGRDMSVLALPESEAHRVLRQVGRELAKLHRQSPERDELPGVPVDDAPEDPRLLVARLLDGGWLDSGTARWLTGWFGRLAARLPADPPRVLLHGDIAPQNLLVAASPARLSAVVDWGDAMWADPAAEFAKIPLGGVPAMLDGYRQEAGEPAGQGDWEARVLWHHLTWALGRLPDPVPRPGERHWTAPPASRLLGLLRFFAAGPPPPWPALA
ncbi:aminoglycoside phosphotransferase family protein [Streptomyces sp. NPDC050610]|uniref:phosphotransferase family protein n=1 Tax=Streptomyces sp. NPDC050610 TaxID=3157097 RepID=UPI00341524F5